LVFDGTKFGINVTPVAGTDAKLQLTGGTTNATTLATSYSAAAVVFVPKSTSGYSLAFASGTSDFPQLQVSANGAAGGDLLIQPYGGNTKIGGVVTMPNYGVGTATFSAAGVISSVSDETWKIKDGVPVNTDAMLKKLQPGYWYYNDEKKEIFGKDRQLGFYAQNVNTAIGPEAAPEPEEGKPWGYYDRSVLAVVVMSLQKALDTIESLETRLAALEQK
jgi:hypothetical protein